MRNICPDYIIAGALPLAPGMSDEEAREAAYHNAAVVLDDEDVMLIASRHEDTAYYLAAHSRDFIYSPEAGCSLANALPGMPNHQGEGIYLFEMSDRFYAVETRSNNVSACWIKREELCLPRYEGAYHADTMTIIPWEGFRLKKLMEQRRTAKRALDGAVLVLSTCAVLLLFLAGMEGYATRKTAAIKSSIEQSIQAASAIIEQNAGHPIEGNLHEIQKLSEIAESITKYSVTNGQISWVARIPKWVSAAEYEKYGPGLKKEVEGDFLVIRKGGGM